MSLGPQFDPQYGDGLYHGTYRDVKDAVLPASHTSHQAVNFKGLSNPDRAYATENEDTAWELSHNAQQRYAQRAHQVAPRTRVYELKPNEDMEVGSYHPDHEDFDPYTENLSEWTAPKFEVARQIDIRPEQQGTFNLNWNQFKGKNRTEVTHADALNHPTDEDIEQGHSGSQMRNDSAKNFWDPEVDVRKRAEKRALANHPTLF